MCSRTTGCGTGYTLNSASGLCEDDDECILGMHNCFELGTQFQCRNTLGSYRCERIKCIGDCYYKKYTTTTRYLPTVRETTKTYPNVYQIKQCLPGYQMNKFGVCEGINKTTKIKVQGKVFFTDIDECSSNPCKRNEKCYNLGGRHQCVPLLECRAGYELNESGSECNGRCLSYSSALHNFFVLFQISTNAVEELTNARVLRYAKMALDITYVSVHQVIS